MRIRDWSSDVCSSDLSNDLGAVGGLLFDIGSGRFPAPPRSDSTENARDWTAMLDETRAQAQKLDKSIANQKESDRTHGEIQSWLRDPGLALGYDVWIAANDWGRLHEGLPLGSRCLDSLPHAIATAQGSDAIRLINVLSLEHSTEIGRAHV